MLGSESDETGRRGVEVISGSNQGSFPTLSGKTVRVAKEMLQSPFNLGYFTVALVDGNRVCVSHVLSDYATLEFVGIGLKGVDDEPYEEQLARAIIDDNPPLQKIAADIRKMNLDIDESITVALAAAKKHFEEMYGPLIPECFAVLNAVVRHLQSTSEDVRRIAEQVGKSGVEPAALDRDAAADYLGIETKTLDYLVRRRKIRFVQVGDQRGRVFRISDLDGFLNENVELTADEILRVRKPK